MVRDNLQVLSDAQSVILNAAAAALSTNVFQLPTGENWKKDTVYPSPHRLGKMRVFCSVSTALAAAVDGAVLTIGVYTHSTTTVNSGTLIASKSVTVNTAGTGATAAGTIIADLMIPQDTPFSQYLGVYYSVATQNVSAGAVDCALVKEVEKITAT